MATTKLSATKSTSRAINYAEKRAVEKSGLNCDVDYAKSSFKASRELYGKTDGNQGHVIIQSFKPGEVTPEQCNQLGLALAEKLVPNHQVAVYTHNDTDHVHNHIVINSIDLETGKKFNNNKQALRNVRNFNDEVCMEHGLSVPEKNTARLRYTQTEKAIADPNTKSTAQYSWKDEIREAIDQSQATNMDEFKDHLNQHGIEIERVTPKSITYRHLAEDKRCVDVNSAKITIKEVSKMALKDKYNTNNKQNEYQTPTSNPNDELQVVMNQLNEIQVSLKQIGTNSPKTQMSLSVADKLQSQQDLLMKRLEEIEKRENERNKRHDELLTTIETTASNFNQATEITQKRFISVAKHYIERINNDNLKQDFQTAIQEELKDVKTDTHKAIEQLQTNQSELRQANNDYKKMIDERIKHNDTAMKQYDQAFNRLTKGITAMFFIIALVMVAFLVLSPLGDWLGVQHFYEWLNYVLKTGHSVWRYLIVIFYLVPYVFFGMLIYAILSAYKRI